MARHSHSRRDVLIGSGIVLAGLALPSNLALAQGAELPPTPECRDAHDVTPRQTEGPYYTPMAPERAALREPGMKGMLGRGILVAVNARHGGQL